MGVALSLVAWVWSSEPLGRKALSSEDSEVVLTRIRAEPSLQARSKRGGRKKKQKDQALDQVKEVVEQKRPEGVRLGVNEVTKALEKGELALVICCRHVRPFILIQHLPVLAALHKTPVCSLDSQSASFQLGRLFGLRTMMAVGFTKDHPAALKGLVDFCTHKAEVPIVPWLPIGKEPVTYKDPVIEPRRKNQKVEP